MRRKRELEKGMVFKRATVLTMIFVTLFFCLVTVDASAGDCEDALLKCMKDPWWHMVPGGPIYCATGYLFCKKYIEG